LSSKGFAGRTAIVDLGTGAVEVRRLDEREAERFGGGLGLCIALAARAIPGPHGALGQENAVVIGAGPFVGTDLPATSRVYAVSALPCSNSIGWCGAGGMTFGCGLKYAGFDHVVVKGASSRPVYLSIHDDGVDMLDASWLSGKGAGRTCEELKARHGAQAGVLAVGPAGERLVSFAMAYVDGVSTLGRGGLGAVMGSKNLKAVVAGGSRGIGVADPVLYRSLRDGLVERIRRYPYLASWQDLGLLSSLPVVPAEVYRRLRVRRLACVSCPLGDKDMLKIEGAAPGDIVCSSSAVNLFMPLVYGMTDPLDAARCIARLDELGMDMFEFFGIMRLAASLQEMGLISGDPVIDVSSPSSMLSWADKVVERDGVGDTLAGGFDRIVREFGEQALRCAPPTFRGMVTYVGPLSALPWTYFGTMELGQILDPRGPHVGASGSPTYFARRGLEVFPGHLARMGVPEQAVKRILQGREGAGRGLNVGRLLRYSHRWFTILGSLGVCARAQVNRFYSAGLLARLYEAVTGIPTDAEKLAERADRSWTLLALANAGAGRGLTPGEVPRAWYGGEGFRDYVDGTALSLEDIGGMIADYYDEQGWDPVTGRPSPARLQELGLAE